MWQAVLLQQPVKGRKSKRFTGGFRRFAEQQIARSVVRGRQRVAVFFVAQSDLALVVRAPQVVGFLSRGQGRALRVVVFAPVASSCWRI